VTIAKLSGPMLAPASGGAPKQAVVLLHGYGSDGADLIGLAPAWQAALPDALFVSPNAPEPAGMGFGFQWFAIAMQGDRLASRQDGVAKGRPVLVNFLEELWAQTGIAPEQTLLVGFSQGAMMALHVGTSLTRPLMGVIGFSGALLPPEGLAEGVYARPPICLVHGDMDEVVDPNLSVDAERLLSQMGFDVRLHLSRGVGHGIAPDGLDFATAFIAEVANK